MHALSSEPRPLDLPADGLYIPLEKIKDDASQVRVNWGYNEGRQKLNDLVESIRSYGILQPIEVSLRDDGYYVVLVGHRRVEAAKRAGLESVPAVVRVATSEERRILQLIENILRADISAVDEGAAYAEVKDRQQLTMQQLADMIGVSYERVASRLRIISDPLLKEATEHNLISARAAYELTWLPNEYANFLRQQLRCGLAVSLRDVRAAHDRQAQDQVVSPVSNTKRSPGYSKADERNRVNSLRRRALYLREVKHMSYAAIAQALGVARGTGYRLCDEAKRMGLEADGDGLETINCTPSAEYTAQARRRHAVYLRDVEELSWIAIAQAMSVTRSTARKLYIQARNRGITAGRDLFYASDPDTASSIGESSPQGTGLAITLDAKDTVLHVEPVSDPDVTHLRFLMGGSCIDATASVVQWGAEHGWNCAELLRKIKVARQP